jgi:hypothetical protein
VWSSSVDDAAADAGARVVDGGGAHHRHDEQAAFEMMARSVRLSVVCVSLLASGWVQAQTGGVRIAGQTTDGKGGVLPGVTVRLTGGTTLQAVTDADGRYLFTELPTGHYTLTATLSGFQPSTREIAAAAPGSFAVDVPLYFGCSYAIDFFATKLPMAIAGADAVLYVRVADAGRAVRMTDGDCIEGYEHKATVLAAVKSPRLSSDTIRLVRTGRTSPGPRAGYNVGDELIVFLQRHQSGAFVDFGSDAYPVRDGRVQWTRDDLPGVTDGSPVRQVLEGLRSTLSMIR